MAHVTSLGAQWAPINSSELRGDESDNGDTSPLASAKHYKNMAKKGRAKLGKMAAGGQEPKAIESDYNSIKDRAYAATRGEWGGQTIHPVTGQPINPASGLAVTVRDPGQQQISVHMNASRTHFDNAMEQAKQAYLPQLGKAHHALGVFRDDTTQRIDFDPVAIADRPVDARAIGAYTHAAGGAYDFKTGNGVWVPHVSRKAAH
jgi:hypothetical protein